MRALLEIGMVVMLASSVYSDPCSAPSREVVLDAIRVVESRGSTELYPHRDGRSWGKYGLTQIAVDELIRLGKLASGTLVQHVCNGVIERSVAGHYLDVCMERAREAYGEDATWLHAGLVYHGGTGERLAPARVAYGRKLRRAIEEAAR